MSLEINLVNFSWLKLWFQLLGSIHHDDSSDGQVVRASASGAIDLGLIPSLVKLMTLKLVFTAFLLDAQH